MKDLAKMDYSEFSQYMDRCYKRFELVYGNDNWQIYCYTPYDKTKPCRYFYYEAPIEGASDLFLEVKVSYCVDYTKNIKENIEQIFLLHESDSAPYDEEPLSGVWEKLSCYIMFVFKEVK